jgi:hypothetical protein
MCIMYEENNKEKVQIHPHLKTFSHTEHMAYNKAQRTGLIVVTVGNSYSLWFVTINFQGALCVPR